MLKHALNDISNSRSLYYTYIVSEISQAQPVIAACSIAQCINIEEFVFSHYTASTALVRLTKILRARARYKRQITPQCARTLLGARHKHPGEKKEFNAKIITSIFDRNI